MLLYEVVSESVVNVYNPKRNLYREVTDKIIALIEKGVAPWHRTWSTFGLARNYASGHIYTGINFLLLNNTEFSIPCFMTFNQVKERGGQIRKGAKAEKVIFFKVHYWDSVNNQALTQEEAASQIEKGRNVQVLKFIRCYHVFNIADIKGVDFVIPDLNLRSNERLERCESIIDHMPNRPEIKGVDRDRAFYSPEMDFVNIPSIKQFETSEDYYASLFHELVHSTGHASRLAREEVMNARKFGSEPYSCEEMVAELGASFLCASVHIDYDHIMESNAAYLTGWLKVLKEDAKFLFRAAADGQKAANYILNLRANKIN